MSIRGKLGELRGRSPEQLLLDVNTHLPAILSLFLVLLIAWYAARLVWTLVPAGESVEWVRPAPNSTAAVMQRGSLDTNELVSAHLFGKADPDASPEPAADITDAPETRLNLELRGAIAADDTEQAHAIIADGSGNEKVYFVGDPVGNGAKLHRVLPDRVILSRGGALETLRLPREFSGSPVQTARSLPVQQRPSMPRRGGSASRAAASTFADIIRPQPFMPNGELRGFRVYPGRDRQRFSALGLRPGDLVTELNGTPMTDPSAGTAVFQNLSEAKTITATIERNGKTETMTLDLTTLSTDGGALQ